LAKIDEKTDYSSDQKVYPNVNNEYPNIKYNNSNQENNPY